jgi:hypothetical protein
LQSVCEEIFLGGDSDDGLLSNPPNSIDDDLREIIQNCTTLNHVSDFDHDFSPQEMKMIDLLRDILGKTVSPRKNP